MENFKWHPDPTCMLLYCQQWLLCGGLAEMKCVELGGTAQGEAAHKGQLYQDISTLRSTVLPPLSKLFMYSLQEKSSLLLTMTMRFSCD